MKIEVRNDSVIISGYVNAIERDSKPIKDKPATAVPAFLIISLRFIN